MKLRRAGPADAAALAALTRAAYTKWVAVLGREPLPMQVDYAQAVTRHRFDVLEDNGALVGLVETTPDGDRLLIVNLAVAPARQGAGIGARLLDCADALAAKAGLHGLRLYTNALFAENIRFYARHGFVVERETPFASGAMVYMVKPLA